MSDIKESPEGSEQTVTRTETAPAVSAEGVSAIQGNDSAPETTDRSEGAPAVSVTSADSEKVLKEERPSGYLKPKTVSAMQGEE